MVTPFDSSSNHHPPTTTTTIATTTAATDTATLAVTNSPSFPRKTPWAQVVRGTESEPTSAVQPSPPPSSSSSSTSLGTPAADQPPSSSSDPPPSVETSNPDCAAAAAAIDSSDSFKANNNNVGSSKKPAWNKPSNGGAVNVMGAAAWPALSESTRHSAKSTPESSSLPASDGSFSTPQGSVASHSPQKQAGGNAKPNPTPNYGVSNNRQRPIKRGGGSNGNSSGPGHAQSSFSAPPPPPPPFPVLQIPPSTFANGLPGVQDPSPGDPYRNNNWGPSPLVGGFLPPMMEHQSPSRRGNFGNHPRGDGYHNNYGSRRDPDRGNYAYARDAHLHPTRTFPRRIMRPPPPNTPAFMGPQPMQPFSIPAGFPEYHYFPTSQFEPFGGMPFFTHGPPSAMFYPVAETSLTNTIVKQIDYYFSDPNLVKDEFLRSNMDEHGWVPINLIASFPRVKDLTNNIAFILDSMRTSNIVEVEGDKLRRRNEWMKWLSAPRRADDSSRGSSSNNLGANDTVNSELDPAATNGDHDSIVE